MDGKWPLKCLGKEILCASSKQTLSEEREIVKSLCLISAMGVYFHIDRDMLLDTDSDVSKMVSAVERFMAVAKDVNTNGLHFTFEKEIFRVVSIPKKLNECLVLSGAGCCFRLTCPFLTQTKQKDCKPLDKEFVLMAIQIFEASALRVGSLWSKSLFDQTDKTSDFHFAAGMLIHEYKLAYKEKLANVCKLIASLMLEFFALSEYVTAYASLTADEKLDVSHKTVRAMFWKASFWLAFVDNKWDSNMYWTDETRKSAWLDGALSKYLGRFPVLNLYCKNQCYLTMADANIRLYFFQALTSCLDRMRTTYTAVGTTIAKLDRCLASSVCLEKERVQNAKRELCEMKLESHLFFPRLQLTESLKSSLLLADVLYDLELDGFDEIPVVSAAQTEMQFPLADPSRDVARMMAEIDSFVNDVPGENIVVCVDDLINHGQLVDGLAGVVLDDEDALIEQIRVQDEIRERKERESARVAEQAAAENALIAEEIVLPELIIILVRELAEEKFNEIKMQDQLRCERVVMERIRAGTVSQELRQEFFESSREEINLHSRQIILDQARSDLLPAQYRRALMNEMRTEVADLAAPVMLMKSKTRTLPVPFAQQVVRNLVSALDVQDELVDGRPVRGTEGLLDDVQCFVCYSSLDFSVSGNGFLLCCEGGSFACIGCMGTHAKDFKHEVKNAWHSVHLVASIRRDLKVREFGV